MAKRKLKIISGKLTKSETISMVLSVTALIISIYSTYKSIQLTELTAGLKAYPELKGTLRIHRRIDETQEIVPDQSQIYLLSLFNSSTVDAYSIEINFIDHKLGEYADSARISSTLTDTSSYRKTAFFVDKLEPYKTTEVYFKYFNYEFVIHEIRISYFRQVDGKKFYTRGFFLYVPKKGLYKEKVLKELLASETRQRIAYKLGTSNLPPLDSVRMFVNLLDSVKSAPLSHSRNDMWDF